MLIPVNAPVLMPFPTFWATVQRWEINNISKPFSANVPVLIARPAFYCQLNNQYLISYCRKANIPGSHSWLRSQLSIVNRIINILHLKEKGFDHTWKPALTFFPKLYCELKWSISLIILPTEQKNIPGSHAWLHSRLSIVNQIINILYHTAFKIRD